jgi:hypothetical protein
MLFLNLSIRHKGEITMFAPSLTLTMMPLALSKTVSLSVHLHLIAHKSSIFVAAKSG